jgi:ppGpp synthetase/RelA/SpoT-type nucleotidyltranferase
MKIPLSIKDLYASKVQIFEALKEFVDTWVESEKKSKWHYESRVKELESFSLKFETGRFDSASIFDDFFGGMIVVPTHSEITKVEDMLREKFSLVNKKPNDKSFATYSPEHFVFDDLRLYLKFDKDKFLSPKVEVLDQLVFEVQIKTFLQHAWALSTHDLVYKSENISWSKHRVAYQVKAMLENIELSISSAEALSSNEIINKEDKRFKKLGKIVTLVDSKWDEESLPRDKKRLAENIFSCVDKLGITLPNLSSLIDESSCNTLKSISPYQSILMALINYKIDLFEEGNPRNLKLLISEELEEILKEENIKYLRDNQYVISL